MNKFMIRGEVISWHIFRNNWTAGVLSTKIRRRTGMSVVDMFAIAIAEKLTNILPPHLHHHISSGLPTQ